MWNKERNGTVCGESKDRMRRGGGGRVRRGWGVEGRRYEEGGERSGGGESKGRMGRGGDRVFGHIV